MKINKIEIIYNNIKKNDKDRKCLLIYCDENEIYELWGDGVFYNTMDGGDIPQELFEFQDVLLILLKRL